MDFFKNLFSGILPKEDLTALQKSELEFDESIVRSTLFEEQYNQWLDKEIVRSMLDDLKMKWERHLIQPSEPQNFQVHRSNLSNGFYVRTEEPWNEEDYTFLIHYWIEKMKFKGYVQKRAHRALCEEGGLLKCCEEYYLKPSLKYRRELPYEQLFGNIEIHYRSVNGHGRLLKLMANTYSDRSYQPAKSFKDLLDYIFVL